MHPIRDSFCTKCIILYIFFFFNDTATPEISPLSLHDALPIYCRRGGDGDVPSAEPERGGDVRRRCGLPSADDRRGPDPGHVDRLRMAVRIDDERLPRSEEHTSELQSQSNLVCRLLLEKKKTST